MLIFASVFRSRNSGSWCKSLRAHLVNTPTKQFPPHPVHRVHGKHHYYLNDGESGQIKRGVACEFIVESRGDGDLWVKPTPESEISTMNVSAFSFHPPLITFNEEVVHKHMQKGGHVCGVSCAGSPVADGFSILQDTELELRVRKKPTICAWHFAVFPSDFFPLAWFKLAIHTMFAKRCGEKDVALEQIPDPLPIPLEDEAMEDTPLAVSVRNWLLWERIPAPRALCLRVLATLVMVVQKQTFCHRTFFECRAARLYLAGEQRETEEVIDEAPREVLLTFKKALEAESHPEDIGYIRCVRLAAKYVGRALGQQVYIVYESDVVESRAADPVEDDMRLLDISTVGVFDKIAMV